MNSLDSTMVYLETGKKRAFAGAIDWPGWCRSGQDEKAALQALCDYGKRYASIPHSAQIAFHPPVDVSTFTVVERINGSATTDFGAPGTPPSSDSMPVDEAELQRLQALLAACWQALDAAANAAEGKELRSGPRGGGRNEHEIIRHVQEAENAYLSQLGVKINKVGDSTSSAEITQIRQAILKAITSAVNGEIPARGPRGGLRWSPRYFVRRAAWHVLDHAWEIEDRIL
jgi:hypothetical protein